MGNRAFLELIRAIPDSFFRCGLLRPPHDEMVKILAACDGWQITTPVEGKLNTHRLKTLVLLMRYTGMQVSDAVTLTTDRLDGKRCFSTRKRPGCRSIQFYRIRS
jgi:hypothetical protein